VLLMRNLFDQLVCQPTRAFTWGMEMLVRRVGGLQMLDAIVSRVVHTLNRPPNVRADEEKNEMKGRYCD
jgi:hypothetical protein